MEQIVLRTEHATMRFGGVTAVNDLNLEVGRHEIVAIIGPNGAGKTTAFNLITGVYTPTQGKVFFTPGRDQQAQPVEITGKKADAITKMGMARTFQNIRLFKSQTVYENILIGQHLHVKAGLFSSISGLAFKEERAMRDKADALLELLGLSPCERRGLGPAARRGAAPGGEGAPRGGGPGRAAAPSGGRGEPPP